MILSKNIQKNIKSWILLLSQNSNIAQNVSINFKAARETIELQKLYQAPRELGHEETGEKHKTVRCKLDNKTKGTCKNVHSLY